MTLDSQHRHVSQLGDDVLPEEGGCASDSATGDSLGAVVSVKPAADTATSGPVNWPWFARRRCGLGSFLVSCVTHAALLLLLLKLGMLNRGLPEGKFLTGQIELTRVIEIPVVLRELPAEVPLSSGDHTEIRFVDQSIPEPGTVELAQVASEAREIEAPIDPVDEVRQLFGPGSNVNVPLSQVRGGAEFFGITSPGNRFVFVIDGSWSMKGVRWRQASQELLNAVKRLRDDQRFYVLIFDRQVHRMFGPTDTEDGFLPAIPENANRLSKWLETVELGYETDPNPALRFALNLQPDAVFLLSDGEYHEGLVINSTTSARRGDEHGTVIHAVGLHSREGELELQRIARENEGLYRFIPDPTPDSGEFLRQRAAERVMTNRGVKLERDEFGRITKAVFTGDDEGLMQLRGLPYLERLSLAGSQVTDVGMREVAQLRGLQVLVLSNADISECGLQYLIEGDGRSESVHDDVQLQALYLDGTQIGDDGMKYVGRLKTLRELSTPGRLTNAGLAQLTELTELESLYLAEHRITNQGLVHLQGLRSLEHLSLTNAAVNDDGLASLKRMQRLQVLDLSGTRVRGPGLPHLGHLPRLRMLVLNDSWIDDDGARHLATLPQLEVLHLNNTRLSDAAIGHLEKLTGLRELSLHNTRFSNQGKRQIQDALPRLEWFGAEP